MTCIQILPLNTIFCKKNHKFRMTWLEKYMYCYASAKGASKNIWICSLVNNC